MRTVKRIDLFLLKTFLPLFIMTFGICLFIFLMQFLWMYIDEMIGKGIEMQILAQLFLHATMKLVPDALPLAILFASLMTFGNLGEQLELLAMKSSGISLVRIMRPLMIFLIFTAITAFFFQNNAIPVSQLKFYTILSSVRQKSPELEIPEKTFSGINGQNIRVMKKDKKKKLLIGVMIYDYSGGFNSINVIVADSGRLKTSTDKKYLVLTLYDGESAENFKGGKSQARNANETVPFKRESFDVMEMLIEYDDNFNMGSESVFQDRFVSKNIASLRHSIDSMTIRLDSIKEVDSKVLFAQSYRKTLARRDNRSPEPGREGADTLTVKGTINFDSLYREQKPNVKASLLSYSKRNIDNLLMNYGHKSDILKFDEKEMRLHHTEMHKKFTLSFACLVFFFIGAPLGAIIRKGGLGAPAVISVILFVFYYIVNNIGYKMARDGIWEPWQGMWLSSAVLLPLGIFLTYKAVNDSVLLNAETYIDFLKRFIGKREYRKIEKKDVIMEIPDYDAVETRLSLLRSCCEDYIINNKRPPNYIKFWKQGGIDNGAEPAARELDSIVEVLENSDNNLVLNKTMDFPIIKSHDPARVMISRKAGVALAIIFPLGGLVYMIAAYRHKLLRHDIMTTARVCDEMTEILKQIK